MRITIFLLFCMLLMLSLNLEEVEARCYPNGCSIPGNLPFFYKRRFTPACNKHDVCYACGVRNGWGRYQCDTAFKRDMYKLCESVGRFTRGICRGFANGYYKAVRNYGSDNYDNPSLWWCPSCPSSKGDPNVSLGR
ncbi:uncharacterized protein LOC144651964 [Oculina patagonica]